MVVKRGKIYTSIPWKLIKLSSQYSGITLQLIRDLCTRYNGAVNPHAVFAVGSPQVRRNAKLLTLCGLFFRLSVGDTSNRDLCIGDFESQGPEYHPLDKLHRKVSPRPFP